MTRWLMAGCLALMAGLAWPGLAAQTAVSAQDRDWCADAGDRGNDDEVFCEVREVQAGRLSELRATSNPNGSIRVSGGNRQDVLIRARVTAHADSMDGARAIAKDVRVTMDGGNLRTDGPTTRNRRYWSVSFRIETPRNIDLTLESSNGSLDLSNVNGRVRAESSNGSVRLTDMAGDVRVSTSNGSLNVILGGTTWEGAGLEAITSNGSVRAEIPANYNARLVAGTSNGSLSIDMPVTVQGRISPRLETTLGKGGATIRLQSSNGSVGIRRR